MSTRLNDRDLQFIVGTLTPEGADRMHVFDRLRKDKKQLDVMLDDKRLFQRLMGEEDILVRISPWLFFTILLRRAWRDLEGKKFTVEQRNKQKVLLFDVDRVVRLLAQEPVRDYLARMLASFMRLESVTLLVPVRRGRMRGYRIHEFDLEGMMRYSQTLDETFRFAPYKRMGDVCLFLAGVFPEHIKGQYRYPQSGQVRPRMRGRLYKRVEDYESYGRAFYRMAAEHEQARREGLSSVLAALSENFILAEKPLDFIATHYLQFTRSRLFGL